MLWPSKQFAVQLSIGSCSRRTGIKMSSEGVVTCKFCNKKLKTLKGLNKHISLFCRKKDTITKVSHKCDICLFQFKTGSQLSHHISKLHRDQEKHQCTFCDKNYTTLKRLTIHITTIHQQSSQSQDKYKCHICNKRFVYIEDVRKHVDYTHNG